LPVPSNPPPRLQSGDRKAEAGTFGISELASEFMITARAIRFYEDQGLLAPARGGAGGRIRVYGQRDRARLRLVLRGKRLGLSLSDIRDLLDLYESPADTAPQLRRLLAVLDERQRLLNRQLQDLTQTLADIEHHRSQAARMLEALRIGASPPARSTGRLPRPAP